jgi:hypothetical protein
VGATVMTIPTDEAPRHAAISPSTTADVPVRASIGPRVDLIALWYAPADQPTLRSRTERAGWVSFRGSQVSRGLHAGCRSVSIRTSSELIPRMGHSRF